jgi:hypothetical protein
MSAIEGENDDKEETNGEFLLPLDDIDVLWSLRTLLSEGLVRVAAVDGREREGLRLREPARSVTVFDGGSDRHCCSGKAVGGKSFGIGSVSNHGEPV